MPQRDSSFKIRILKEEGEPIDVKSTCSSKGDREGQSDRWKEKTKTGVTMSVSICAWNNVNIRNCVLVGSLEQG